MSEATLKPRENFVLNIQLRNDDDSVIPVSDLSAFEVRAYNQGTLQQTWNWLPDDSGSPYLVLTDGLAELEVTSAQTATWLGHISFQVLPSFLDSSYFVSGSQVDVVCLNGLLVFVQC